MGVVTGRGHSEGGGGELLGVNNVYTGVFTW